MTELLRRLNQANQNLSHVLELLTTGRPVRVALAPEQLAGVLADLLQVGEWLDKRVRGNDPEVAEAIWQYRGHLERLRTLMPSLHAQLLTERARLEAERSHLEGAAAWAETSRSIK